MDDSQYLTTHEAALAVVATAMKKARLRIDTLIINAIMGGILFTTGGMLHVTTQAYLPNIYQENPGLISILAGLSYPIGLFYVVIMGVDLFNSNILFFSTAICRGAVSVFDLLISWIVSYFCNLIGNIFVCYVICHYSAIAQTDMWVQASHEIAINKDSFSFIENFLKGVAGNFYVCLAIYLQLMAKPLHVKFLMMALPVFTFVTIGFTHAIADMTVLITALINHAPVSVGEVAWKIFLPGALGNIVGGSFFGIVITWYLHIYVVEQDQERLKLPKYEVRDEQPELNIDSRVVRQRRTSSYVEEVDDVMAEKQNQDSYEPVPYFSNSSGSGLRLRATNTRGTTFSVASKKHRSPKNVFPVYGMGPPLAREKTIAGGTPGLPEPEDTDIEDEDSVNQYTADYIGDKLKRVITNKPRRKSKAQDIEAGYKSSPSIFRLEGKN
ncbi:putative formate transporter 1 [Spathaspora passalidarum NRRL Y-27907]|uniref:Putative formate transporter 1 n=1 Tax=Spathaspora passalidarum (strain NRRL Y-27907 / 11-Y1) TaxID=619300 RepID=G3AU21_SPAPN|nr:putative formate transporter 1 [Spathaspora passalidarum NRRL Y-27907]EGW30397.1 putative formate transporter 1 [Spathaspora passalidarum NRRL Y-27907]